MRKGLLTGCLLLAVCGIAAMGTPEITVNQPEYDFGSVGLGYMVKHTFTLQNTGDAMLEIVYVRASCGCTTTALPTTSLAPGESMPLEVLVLADHGTAKNVRIYVHTNAPDIYGMANDDRKDVDITLRVKGAITPEMQDNEIAPFQLAYDMMVLVDVRDTAAYADNHFIGAISIPADELSNRMASLQKSSRIIVVDQAGEAADAAVQALLSAGYMSSFYLQGGMGRWVDVQGDLYLTNASPLPPATGNVSVGASGRPYDQGTLRSEFYVLIDLRDAAAYAAGHLAGAINILPAHLSQWVDRFPTTKPIVVYDDDGSLATAAYHILKNAGFTQPRILLGGLNEWTYQYGDAHIMQD